MASDQCHVCIVCGKDFDSEQKYDKHYKTYHESNPKECDVCGTMFETIGSYYNHKKTESQTKHVSCKFCSEEMPQGSMTNHIKRKHKPNSKENIFKCDKCQYESNLKTNLTRHKRSCTSKETKNDIPFVCNICFKSFTLKTNLTRHKILHNENRNEVAFECGICEDSFGRKDNLDKHLKHQHNITEKAGKVQFSDNGFGVYTNDALKKRSPIKVLKKQSNIKMQECDSCNYKTERIPNLNRHITNIHTNGGKLGGSKRKAEMEEVCERTKQSRLSEVRENNPKISKKAFTSFVKTNQTSNKKTEDTVKFFKENLGAGQKSIIEGSARSILKEIKNKLSDEHVTEIKMMITKDGILEERWLTNVIDLEEFINTACRERDVDPNTATFVIGMDGGQGMFIVTLIIIDNDRTKDDKKKDEFKETSHHKILIPALVTEIPENFHNIEVILKALKLDELSRKYKIVADLKLYNILAGMTSASSMFPCVYGECYKTNDKGQKTNQKGRWITGKSRTLGSLRNMCKLWMQETGGDRKLLKHYFNCEFPPLIPGSNDELILDLLSIPYLHTILLGPFNDLWKCFVNNCGESLQKWMLKNHMKGRHEAIGGEYNGKTVKDIIHSDRMLTDLETNVENSTNFVETLRCLARLHNLVRVDKLDDNFEFIINQFCMQWDLMKELYDLSYTLKIHIIETHLPERLRTTGKTLQKESDEHTEQVHHRLRLFKESHQYGVSLRNIGTPCQKKRQHNLVSHWNSLNINK
jgi:hypothetical protein